MNKGNVAVGYRLFNETFYGKLLTMSTYRKTHTIINDYSALYGKCSEFLFMPLERVECFAMRRYNFVEIMGCEKGLDI